MNQFSELYKTFHLERLFKILEEENKYNKSAVQAAKYELEARGVTTQQIKEFQEELILKTELQKQETDKKIESNNIPKFEEDNLFQTIDQINESPITREDDKKQRFLAIILLANTIYVTYDDLNNFSNIFNLDTIIGIYNSTVSILIYFVWFYAVYLFWNKKQLGWKLIIAISIIDSVLTLLLWFQQIYYYSSLYPFFENFKYYFFVIFSLGIIYLMFRPEIKRVFSIDKDTISKTFGIGIFILIITELIPFILYNINLS